MRNLFDDCLNYVCYELIVGCIGGCNDWKFLKDGCYLKLRSYGVVWMMLKVMGYCMYIYEFGIVVIYLVVVIINIFDYDL